MRPQSSSDPATIGHVRELEIRMDDKIIATIRDEIRLGVRAVVFANMWDAEWEIPNSCADDVIQYVYGPEDPPEKSKESDS